MFDRCYHENNRNDGWQRILLVYFFSFFCFLIKPLSLKKRQKSIRIFPFNVDLDKSGWISNKKRIKMASLSEQKYLTLRKRLDQFGFKQPLAIESLPLVEKLFQAFIQTTEELKKAKEVTLKIFNPSI